MPLKNFNQRILARYGRLAFAVIVSLASAPAAVLAHPSTAVPSERVESASDEDMARCKKPIWPTQTLRTGQKGDVKLALLVDAEGKVAEAFVRKSSRVELLDMAARNAILACRFKPQLVNGNPVPRWKVMTYHFILLSNGYDEPTEKMVQDRRKALEGNLDAYYELALGIESEFGDYETALAMVRVAAERGHAGAIHKLADAMWHGVGLPMNQPKALGYFMSAAELGHADSEYEIGMAYANGVGVMPSAAKAKPWLKKAAEQGMHEAQVALGDLLASEVDAQPDFGAIANLYQQAAQGGDELGQLRLGQCYSNGTGTEKDMVKAAYWLRKAADQRQPRAEAMLAALYLRGEGVPNDEAQARKLLLRSAAGGEPMALRTLAAIAATPDEAQAWLQKLRQTEPRQDTKSNP